MANESDDIAIDISGPAGLGAAADIYGRIFTALQAASTLTIDLTGAEDVDISLMQTIEAARRFGAANDKRVKLAAPATGDLLAQLERCGLLASDVDRVFWLAGAEA
jgi:hypothetical protein